MTLICSRVPLRSVDSSPARAVSLATVRSIGVIGQYFADLVGTNDVETCSSRQRPSES
jgi:hypothetical protein